ncbi:MAG TPA: hypothetical protein VLM40_04090, partial [Gemmata sp.]|nr:hypothetical protein [Gemmata sp.]
ERILGHWFIVNEDSKRKGEPWQINKDKLYMHANVGGFYPGHFYRLDATKTPKEIDIFYRQGGDPNGAAVDVIKGIYELDRNETRFELRLCLGEKSKDRPTAFPEKPKPGEVLILHRTPTAADQPMTKEEKLRALTDKVLAAHGGEDKLKKLTSFTMTVKHSNGETQHYFVQPPKNFRWETTHPDRMGKRIVILFPEGRRWWSKEPGEDAKEFFLTGVEPLTVAGWFDYVKFFGPRQVLRLNDPDHKVALLDEEVKIGDRAAVGVQVKGPQYDHKMYFDKETHLLLKSFGVNLRETTYGDYKKFDGIPIAQTEHDGYFEPKVTDFKVVKKFDDLLFERP